MNADDTFGHDVAAEDLGVDPVALLCAWLQRCDGTVTPLMTLSTIDPEGYPDSRHVLLSQCDEQGRISFHTDARSRKAAELAAVPRASLAVAWPGLARQLVVSGDVTRQDRAAETAAYARRSRYLQLLAWLNDQEAADAAPADRHTAWAAFDAAHPVLTPPPTWAGFVVTPRRIAFWRGDTDGPSQRLLCRRTHEGWTLERHPG